MPILEPYNPTWVEHFDALSRVLKTALGNSVRAIHHVGSTAVHGLVAKPILDIDIEIDCYEALPEVDLRLQRLGYENHGDRGIPDRIAFGRRDSAVPWCTPPRAWMEHHLYVCPSFSRELKRHIAFRDRLLGSLELREEYARLKREIEAESHGDRTVYAGIKERHARTFIERALEG